MVDAKNKHATKLDAAKNNAKRQIATMFNQVVDGYNDYVDSSK